MIVMVVAFVCGCAVPIMFYPLWAWARKMMRLRRGSTTLQVGRITTVSQVLHLAVQGAPIGIVVVDKEGVVALSNSAAHDMGVVYERTLNSSIGEQAREVFLLREPITMNLDLPQRWASRVSVVQVVIKPLTLLDERFVIIFSTDESENARMESARRDFVANVSHELKTPVGSMSLLAEALLESKDDPEIVDHFGTKLISEAQRMGALITELIALSKLQGAERLPNMEKVIVSEVITEAIARNDVTAQKLGIPIEHRRAHDTLCVCGDHTLLVTAVSNLIGNALNYSSSSLPIVVEERLTENNTIQIVVEDHGIGISDEDQERIFERFFRVDKARSRSTGGTGLGLAIVKHVAANHGGSVTLDSTMGVGSTFTIELPAYVEEEQPETPKGAVASEPTIPGLESSTWQATSTARRLTKKPFSV